MRRAHRPRVVLPILALALVATALPATGSGRGADAAPSATPRDLGTAKVGHALYWEGQDFAPTVQQTQAITPGSVACGRGVECFDYSVQVKPGGQRLRVAIDQTRVCDVLQFDLLDPAGQVVAHGTTDATAYAAPSDLRARGILPLGEVTKVGGGCGFSTEVFAPAPQPGTWTIRVVGSVVTDTHWRGRLLLEGKPKPVHGDPELLPDLVSTPPYEFTFTGVLASGCRPEEIRNYDAERCLRFSIGPQNRGAGTLDLRYASVQGVTEAGRVRQRIYTASGQISRERDAGTYRYHLEHGHYHYAGFGLLDLYKVEGSAMHKVSVGPKVGACTGPYGIVEWTSFDTAVRGSAPHDCAFVSPLTGAAIGLEPGWGDVYAYHLEGNYVEFGGLPDGRYCVVVGTDAKNEVEESDETNNVAYAVVDVKGNTVRMVERGFGSGPFDPDRTPADDRYPAYPTGE